MTDRPGGKIQIHTEIRATDAGSVALVRLEGEVDLANADELEAALFSEPCSSCPAVAVDLLEVPFMDSSGLRVLLLLRERYKRTALVVDAEGPVSRLLGLAEMTDVFPTYATGEEAVAGLGGT